MNIFLLFLTTFKILYEHSENNKIMKKILDDEEISSPKHETLQHEIVEHTIYENGSKPTPAPLELDSKTSIQLDFDLDIFQIEAIKAVNTGNSVLVVASTSAGKSVIAYHSILKSIENESIAIYTAPVKSLANQKYIELSNKFDDVALITGDVTTSNSMSSKCLVMTAEVLRNQLFSELYASYIQKVKYIILDEAHYLSDEQRGVVWEQIIIASPPNVRFVLLTATLPNYYDLATWLSIIRKEPIHCIYQKRRPVPLHIYAIKESGSPILIKEGDEPLKTNELTAICATTNELGSVSQNSTIAHDPPPYEIANLANSIVSKREFPLLIFCLSRRRCFKIAKHLSGLQEFGDDAIQVFDAAAEDWDPQTKKGPQFEKIRNLVMLGVGVHHSGILPIIRETIELLFSAGKLPILVATETFALGVNAPTRSVMFASLVKWGGTSFRPITASEFLQMAGRAGRRGFDEHGNVYIFVSKGDSPEILSNIVGASPEKLVSRMRVTSSLILSCIQMHYDPHEFLRKSLLYFLNNKSIPYLRKKLWKLFNGENSDSEKSELHFSENLNNTENNNSTNENETNNDFAELEKYATLLKQIVTFALAPTFIKDTLKKGRLVYIVHDDVKWGWSVVNTTEYGSTINVFVSATKDSNQRNIPSSVPKDSFIASIKFPFSSICAISSITISQSETINGLSSVARILGPIDVVRKKYGSVPLFKLDKFKISQNAKKVLIEFDQVVENLTKKDKSKNIKRDYVELCSSIEEKIKIQHMLDEIVNPPSQKEIDLYKSLFQQLNYTTNEGVVLSLKGTVALSLHVEDPLPIVELLFSGFFVDLNSTEICIAASCFVESQPKIKSPETPFIIELWSKMESKLSDYRKIEQDLGLRKSELPKKRMMYFLYMFLEKKSLNDAISSTASNSFTEGIAVRILKRVRELLHQFESAAKVMKVEALVESFSAAQALLLEGSNFESSLYKIDD